jgi:hypothetical protein
MMRITFKFTIYILMAASLVACGGGEGGGSIATEEAPVAPVATKLTGKVIDGYIQGAKVCLDLNNNYTCDDDEPYGDSGEGGVYSFTYEGSIPEGTQILANIPIGAVDEDLGVVDKPYNMVAPASNPEVVTPLTTLVSQEINSSAGQLTPEEAEQSVKLMLGVGESESLLGVDFVADDNTDLQETATTVAEVLAVAQEAITNNPASSDLTPAEISKASLQTAKSITSDLIASGSSTGLATEDVATLVTNVVTGEINNIVAASKSGDGVVVSLIQEIKEGNLIILSEGDNEITEDGLIAFREGLEMEFVYFPDAVEGVLVDITSANEDKVAMLVYDGPLADTWVPIEWYDEDYRIADNGKWTLPTDLQGSGTKVTENCATFYGTGSVEPSREICFIRKDVSGKQVRDIVPDFCSDGEGGVLEGCDEFADLPSGSFVYDATLTIAENEYGGEYILWESHGWRGYLDGAPSDEQTIQDFIGKFIADPNRYAFRGDDCNIAFRITSYATEERSGLIEWADASDGNCGSGGFSWAEVDTTETLPFTVEEVGNETILMTKSPVVLRANNPDEREPYLIFGQAPNGLGQDKNGIYGGTFTPSGTRFSYAFTGNIDYAIFASRVFVDFMLEQAGVPAFPYEEFLAD